MIMQRQSDGTYAETVNIMSPTEEIGEIVDANGDIYFSSSVIKTASGYPCILEKSKGKSVSDYKIYGNTVEKKSVGEPVFAKLYDFDGVRLLDSEGYALCSQDVTEYRIPVVCRGKNLFDYSLWVGESAQGMTIYEDGIKGVPTIRWHKFPKRELSSPIPAGTQLTVSYKFDTTCTDKGNLGVSFYNKSGVDFWKIADKPSGYTETFVIEQDCYYMSMFMCMLPYTENRYCEITNIKIQLELGDTATEYEPYREPVTTNILLDKPLETGEILKYPENVIEHSDGTSESVSLPKIPTLSGTTIVEIDTEIQPENIEITYKSRR